MLLRFRVTNHKSLRDEQHLVLTPSEQQGDELPPPGEARALPVVGIFGPNASGKSNVVRALWDMKERVLRGNHRFPQEPEPVVPLPRWPFRLDAEARASASTYVVDLLLDEQRCTYGFSVTDEAVVEEWLYSYSANNQKTVIFHRRGDDISEGTVRSVIEDVIEFESNALVMEVFADIRPGLIVGDDLGALNPVLDWFGRDLSMSSPSMLYSPAVPAPYQLDDDSLRRLSAILRAADTGIERVSIKKERIVSERGEDRVMPRWLFYHYGGDESDPLQEWEQSQGIRALLRLAFSVLRVLRGRGKALVVDEIDVGLHTALSARLIELFQSPETNPLNAQLIFTSHDPLLLGVIRGRVVLEQDQIWFTEKDAGGATELYPYSGYGDDDAGARVKRYLAGRFGATPFLDDDLFLAALAERESDESNDAPDQPRQDDR
ncbi:ATP-binding protein [Spiractinospora alimapuensis]|uniref:AAA family ATPase n=1 Tax=Spiractinospora alimapuensis TaxID=2820884 RepID=UPI001F3277F0|nr:ATP-binding protein [Spiractinospora alimapuensis]QVQ51750.1 ATP-binding protein [Spiractinospora alimapuensis]